MVLTLALYLLAINAVTFAAFAHDKRRAALGGRRVPERALLELAAVGGIGGALLARQVLRHKTRKQPFLRHLATIGLSQVVLITVMAAYCNSR